MTDETLDPSVDRAMALVAERYGNHLSLDARVAVWAALVASVEEGFDLRFAWEFDSEVVCRDWLHDAWPVLSDRARASRQRELDALDARFLDATAPVAGAGEQARWWRFRYPLRVTGEADVELPPSWSPPPRHVD